MENLGEKLMELLASMPTPSSCVEIQEQTVNNERLAGTIEVRECTTTTMLDQEEVDGDADEAVGQSLQSYGRSPADDVPRIPYHEDPNVVAAAAAAAAVKFRSNYLPPIGVFWDIENCQVPKGRSAMAVTRVIRDKFFNGYKEAEFIVVCDVQKENKQIVQELNDAQVDLIHVSATCKNAADEKLRQSIRRFADTHGSPAAIILISGDINFAADLSDLRHRKKIHVILLHNKNTSEALILCADEHYIFTKLLEPLPSRTPSKISETFDLLVCNLPDDKDVIAIKCRLKQLSNNCGGRVVQIRSNAAVVRFCSKESADRAQKRMNGEYVFNSKISVKYLKERDANCPPKSRGNSIVRESTASESEAVNEIMNEVYGMTSVLAGPRSLPSTPRYPTSSPVVDSSSNWNGMHCVPRGVYPPPPNFVRSYLSNDTNKSFTEYVGNKSPQIWQMESSQQQVHHYEDDRCKVWDYTTSETSNFRSVKVTPTRTKDAPPFSQQIDSNPAKFSWMGASPRNGSAYNQSMKRRTPSPMYTSRNQDTNYSNGQNPNVNTKQKDRTPSPYDYFDFTTTLPNSGQRTDGISPYRQSDTENEEIENFFNPINSTSSNGASSNDNAPVVLQVTNLDQNINPNYLKRFITSIFKKYVMVLHASVFTQADGTFAVTVKVPSLQDAHYVMSQLHRFQIGSKNILISCTQFGSTPSPLLNTSLDSHALNLPYCAIHTQKSWVDKNWTEQEMPSLPNVEVSLKMLSEKVHKLLLTHSGNMPLSSFLNCYEAEFNESLLISENGVPLEHLLSCLSGIELKQNTNSGKHIIWSKHRRQDENNEENKRISPPLANQLAIFNREFIDLMKTVPRCQIPFKHFISAYHHHFGKQCRVADYGFTKLIDLFEALPHTVQIMGEGNKRVLTLTHRAQVRRFTCDLLRILKARINRQVTFSEFPIAYARKIDKPWDVTNYGVCELDDILSEISENTVVVTCNNGEDRLISLPKRERGIEEIVQTKQFAKEVIELLTHTPQKSMLFNKFVPSYHHYFGHQCRVSNYGFTKLIELFEAIPDIVKINEVEGERIISLTETTKIHVLSEQISKLISCFANPTNGSLNLSNIPQHYFEEFGYVLQPKLYNCNSMLQLMEKLDGSFKTEKTKNGIVVLPIDKNHIRHLGLECRRVLMDAPNHCLTVNQFQQNYEQFYHKKCDIDKYSHSLESFIRIFTMDNERFVELTPLQQFACNAQRVLMRHNGKMNLSQFEATYFKITGVVCRAAQYGYPTIYALLRAIPCTIIIKDMRLKRKVIQLNKKLAAVGLLPRVYASSASPHQDTDSSNDSMENEFFLSVSQNSLNSSTDVMDVVERKDNLLQYTWTKDLSKQENNSSIRVDESAKETSLDNIVDKFFKSLDKVTNTFPPPPPHPNLPKNSRSNETDRHLPIWPPPYDYHLTEEVNSIAGQLSSVTLPALKKISTSEESDLVSSNEEPLPYSDISFPLSSYFSNNYDSVIAPHPSEVPLPAPLFTPEKNNAQNVGNSENDATDRINATTPNKRPFFGKCRLAAQFNQPTFDT